MFVLRGGLSRGQFGLLNEGLYQHAYSGTKKIVERYLEACIMYNFVFIYYFIYIYTINIILIYLLYYSYQRLSDQPQTPPNITQP